MSRPQALLQTVESVIIRLLVLVIPKTVRKPVVTFESASTVVALFLTL